MRIFGKERDSLRIKKAKVARAVFVSQDIQEIEVTLLTENGEKLTLQMRPDLAHVLVEGLTNAYEAIAPPLRRSTSYAQWDGMSE